MLIQIIIWMAVYFTSLFIYKDVGFENQGDAFITIYIIVYIIGIIYSTFKIIQNGYEKLDPLHYTKIALSDAGLALCYIIIILFISWFVSTYFINIDFYAAFMLITLGTALIMEYEIDFIKK